MFNITSLQQNSELLAYIQLSKLLFPIPYAKKIECY